MSTPRLRDRTFAEPEAPVVSPSPPPSSAAPAAEVTAPTAPAGEAPPAGYYEYYFHGTYGLQNSSLVSLDVIPATEYQALEERGRYAVDAGTLRMESGALAGRVAHLEESDGKPTIVFVRDEKEVDGRPTIDVGDTRCYHELR